MARYYEVVLQGTYYSQNWVNRWTYVSSSTLGTINRSTALALAFVAPMAGTGAPQEDGVMAGLKDIQSDQVKYSQLQVACIHDPEDFYQYVFTSMNGDRTTTGLSPTMAMGFRSTIVRRDISRGYKRLIGITEDGVGAGGVLEAAWLGQGAGIAGDFSKTLSYDDEGVAITFNPCIIKRERYNPDTGLASPTGRAYRIPQDVAYLDDNHATGITWEVYPSIRTQRSRQYGQGA